MKPIIVVSCERFFMKSGALIVAGDCLKFLSENLADQFEIKALVYKKDLYPHLNNIHFVEYPNARKSFLLRLYYEYFQFKKLSKTWRPYLWLSLQDSTPRVDATIRAVYVHNPTTTAKLRFKYLLHQPRFTAFQVLSKYIYPLFIRKNNFIILQQATLAYELLRKWKLQTNKIIIAPPELVGMNPIRRSSDIAQDANIFRFIYPATAFVYKNHEAIIRATRLLANRGVKNIEIVFTLAGNENRYARYIKRKASGLNIKFVGFVSKPELNALYDRCQCLIFPSQLETWGLPISESKALDKPIIIADLPYATETLGSYNKAAFFTVDDSNRLADLMQQAANNSLCFEYRQPQHGDNRFKTVQGWAHLFQTILGRSQKSFIKSQ